MKIDNDHAKLIYSITKQFYGVEKEDLFQAGVLGLLKAYKNFVDDGSCKFTTYATKYIYGEMYSLVSNKAIKINRNLRKMIKMINQAKEGLTQKLHRSPSVSEIAQFLEIPQTTVNEALGAASEIMSLDNEQDISLYETIQSDENVNLDDQILIDQSLEMLTEDERNIIKARYYEDLTQCEVARKLKMTQVKVSRYEKKGLDKMQQFMRN